MDVDLLSARLLLIRPHLDERAWRLLLGAGAKGPGRAGRGKLVAGAVAAHPENVAQGVRELDYQVAPTTVATLLKANGYSLQGNAKTIKGSQHPDRDVQFGYLGRSGTAFAVAGDPVIRVDTKKKELIGNFSAAGRQWEPAMNRGNPASTTSSTRNCGK